MNDYLLIGIKDGKITVLAQASESAIIHTAGLLKKKQDADGKLPYDKFIIVQGSILNV